MLPPSQYLFPNPIEHDPDGEGLICIGADLAPSTLLQAYRQGLFPWFSADEPICWWSPEPRCVIIPSAYKPSKTLLRSMKKHNYTLTVNRAFEQVMRNCAAPRSYADETWISEDIIQGYCGLFDAGHAYSIEVWEGSIDAQQLVGGLYGVSIGRGCFGESMFSKRNDVSKMAFYLLMCIAQREQLPWVDCQLVNNHLLSLGACTLSRLDYLNSLQVVITDPAVDWQAYQERVFSSQSLPFLADLLAG